MIRNIDFEVKIVKAMDLQSEITSAEDNTATAAKVSGFTPWKKSLGETEGSEPCVRKLAELLCYLTCGRRSGFAAAR